MHRLLLFALLSAGNLAEGAWILEGFIGGASSLSSTLRIEQPGAELEIDADYEARSFESPLYYSLRVSHSENGNAWEAELIHHKIFLKNTEAPVNAFKISHGYNLLFLNHAWDVSGFQVRAGAGAVIAHPEVNIDGFAGIDEYEFTGPAFQVAAGRRFHISGNVFFALEGKFTAARAHIDLGNGSASVPNYAFHALAGIGVRW